MDINLDSKIGSPTKNVIIETAGRIYIKVGDRLYELDFRNQDKNSSSSSSHSSPIDTSNLVSKEELKSALSSYVTEKTWKSAKATQEAISAVNIPEFKESIDPITVNTMEMLVGAEQLQYDFVNTLGYYTEDENGMPTLGGLSQVVANLPYFDGKVSLVCPAGIIKHYVYGGPEAIQSGIQDYQYCRWIVTGGNFNLVDFPFVEASENDISPTNINISYLNEEYENEFYTYNDSIFPDNNEYYLYIRANIINIDEPKYYSFSQEEEELLKKILGLRDNATLSSYFNYATLLKIYEGIIAEKQMAAEDECAFISLEAKVLNALYNFKIGTASYVLSNHPLSLIEYNEAETGPEYYNFLYAIIGNNGSAGRDITTLNGFTEITPGQVTAYIFKTPDGQQYINFKEGSIHIGQPYLNKEAEWMHYSEEKGLEISGKVTVTGGALKDEIEEITRLANGEYQVWYSDDILNEANCPWSDGENEGFDYNENENEIYWTIGDHQIALYGAEYSGTTGGILQYLPYPNDNSPTYMDKINWPYCKWEASDALEDHIGDLYIVSKEDVGTQDIEQNTSYRFRKKINQNGNSIYYWTRLDDSDLGIILNNIGNLEYLKVALPESTTIAGGLILSSTIALGYTKNGSRIDTAGINGAIPLNSENEYDKRAIAAWFGGGMWDPEVSYDENEHPSYPAILFRHDGSGYIGGLSENDQIPALSWENNSIKIRSDIIITDTDGMPIGTLSSVIPNYFEEEIYFTSNPNTFYSVKRVFSEYEAANDVRRLGGENPYSGYYFIGDTLYQYAYNPNGDPDINITENDDDEDPYQIVLRLKSDYAGLYTQGFVSAFGASPSQGSSGGDASWPEDPRNGYLLSWNDSASEPIWLDPSTLGLKGLTVDSPTSSDDGKALIYSNNKWTLGSVTPSISLTLWGNSISNNTNTNGNSLSRVGGIDFEPDGNNNLASITPSGDTITINGNVIVTGYISAFGDSSSSGSSSGDATSIGDIPVDIENLVDGQYLVYDYNNGEPKWINKTISVIPTITLNGVPNSSPAFYAPENGGTSGYILQSYGNAEPIWVAQSTLSVGSAGRLITSVDLWGQSFNGTSDIGASNNPADLSYVGDINFGNNSIKLSLTSWSSLPATNNTLYVYGNIVASGYISAFGSSNSGGSSSGDASEINGIPINSSDSSWGSPSSGQVLTYGGSTGWILSDTFHLPANPSNGKFLKWSNGNLIWSNQSYDAYSINGIDVDSQDRSWDDIDEGQVLTYGEYGWILTTPFSLPSGYSSGHVLGMSNGQPAWVDEISHAYSADEAAQLVDDFYLWGNATNGLNDIGTASSPATLSHVNNIEFGGTTRAAIINGALSSSTYSNSYLGIDAHLDVSGGLRLANNKYITFKRSNGTDDINLIRVNNMGSSSSHNNQILFGDTDIISMGLQAYFTFGELHFETGGGTQANPAKSAVLLSNGNVYLYNQLKSWYNSVERVIMRMVSGQGVEFGDGTLAAKVTGSSVRVGSTYALSIDSSNGVITIDGNKVILGATTNNPGYYFEIKTSGGSTYLETNLPIVSTSYISAFGQSGSQSYDDGGEDPGEVIGGEPGEDPEEQNS